MIVWVVFNLQDLTAIFFGYVLYIMGFSHLHVVFLYKGF